MSKKISITIARSRKWWRDEAAAHGTTPRALIADTYAQERSMRRAANALGVSLAGLREGMRLYDVMPRQHGGVRQGKPRPRALERLDDETVILTPARVLADKYRISTQAVYKERKRRGRAFDEQRRSR